MFNKFKERKRVLDWDEYQQILATKENIDFISSTASESLRNLSLKGTDEFGMFKQKARTPDEILKGQVIPVFEEEEEELVSLREVITKGDSKDIKGCGIPKGTKLFILWEGPKAPFGDRHRLLKVRIDNGTEQLDLMPETVIRDTEVDFEEVCEEEEEITIGCGKKVKVFTLTGNVAKKPYTCGNKYTRSEIIFLCKECKLKEGMN